jgi:large subunit ribosomal protein L20
MRSKKGAARTQAKKRIFKRAKGYVMGRGSLLRTTKETLLRAGAFARAHRRLKKRNFRNLWVIRVSAAVRARGMRYSEFIAGLEKAQIQLDRKSLSEIAIADPPAFDAIVAEVKSALAA